MYHHHHISLFNNNTHNIIIASHNPSFVNSHNVIITYQYQATNTPQLLTIINTSFHTPSMGHYVISYTIQYNITNNNIWPKLASSPLPLMLLNVVWHWRYQHYGYYSINTINCVIGRHY